MSKPKSSHRVFSRAFKLGIVNRMLAGEKVSALARELKLSSSKELYIWRKRFVTGGPEALRGPGRPCKVASLAAKARPDRPAAELEAAQRRIAALERKVGQQQVELDFFQQALRQVRGARRPSAGPGVTGSTRSSKR
jgi:transposase-like protein